MSLFGSLRRGANSLLATQIGLQVVGNNIANASTPGYHRQRVEYTPAPTQRRGNLLFGLGVDVAGITQNVDKFLQERVRNAASDLASSESQEQAYLQLESIINELSDIDLSSTFNRFFASINDILNQPENSAIRNLAAEQGRGVAREFARIDKAVQEQADRANSRITNLAAEINRLTSQIADLNLQIVNLEGGGKIASDAVGLRDERELALSELASIVDIRAVERATGSVTVFVGGDFLVSDTQFREVQPVYSQEDGRNIASIHLVDTDSPLQHTSGLVAGLTEVRDEVLAEFSEELDQLAQTLIFEFNRVFTSGQGLSGYTSLTSDSAVDNAISPLDAAGLHFRPVNGSFQLRLLNKTTGLTETTDILVRLNGLNDDTTLADLTEQLNTIDGLSVEVTPENRLSLTSDSTNLEFGFANDSSGILAALGLNTFFTGSSAADISVNSTIRERPELFADSRSGIGQDTENAVLLAGFLDLPLDSQNGANLSQLYDAFAGGVIQRSAITQSFAEGFRMFKQTLDSQHLAMSGVSLDEEAVQLIAFQRAFQATSRYIATISDLLDILVNI